MADLDFQRKLDEKIRDDEEFLRRYGSVRSHVPNPRYKEGWERIFGSDRAKESPDDTQPSIG